jgi:hypothetical protein
MERSLRTVNRQISELVAARRVTSKRRGHFNHYILCDLAEKMAYQAASVKEPVESVVIGVSDTPNWRIARAPVTITEIQKPEIGFARRAQQHHSVSSSANDVVASAPHANGSRSADIEQVRSALCKRACVRCAFTESDKATVRRMLDNGATVETIKRAILLGCARKLVSLITHGEGTPIVSMSYFVNVVEEVKLLDGGSGYWQHLENRVKRDEQQWIDLRKAG